MEQARLVSLSLKSILALFALLVVSKASAAPMLKYEVFFEIVWVTGITPGEYGNVLVGDMARMTFSWDSSRGGVLPPEELAIFEGANSPLYDYRLYFGDVVLQNRAPGNLSTDLSEDQVLVFTSHTIFACPVIDPFCAWIWEEPLGGLSLDHFVMTLSCPGWAGGPLPRPTLDCGSGLNGGIDLWGYYDPEANRTFSLSAAPRWMRIVSVSEPGTFALLALGVASMSFAWRKKFTS